MARSAGDDAIRTLGLGLPRPLPRARNDVAPDRHGEE
jgi:hypothetical protein